MEVKRLYERGVQNLFSTFSPPNLKISHLFELFGYAVLTKLVDHVNRNSPEYYPFTTLVTELFFNGIHI